jgi:hypothetical protein
MTHEIHPELLTIGGSDETKKQALKGAILDAWVIFRQDTEFVDHMAGGYRRRIKAVKDVHGRPTEY